MASGSSAKLAASLTMRISARGQRSTADPAGAVSHVLMSSSHPDFCSTNSQQGRRHCVCCGSGGWKESFKGALKITSKGVGKSRFNVIVKAGQSSVARFALLWPRWLKHTEQKQATPNLKPKSTQNYRHGCWGRRAKRGKDRNG